MLVPQFLAEVSIFKFNQNVFGVFKNETDTNTDERSQSRHYEFFYVLCEEFTEKKEFCCIFIVQNSLCGIRNVLTRTSKKEAFEFSEAHSFLSSLDVVVYLPSHPSG